MHGCDVCRVYIDVYVGDIVKVFRQAMERINEGFDVVNACTGKKTSLNSLVEVIENKCGWQVEHKFEPMRKGDIRQSLGNTDKLLDVLGLSLDVSIEEGIGYLLDDIRGE